MPCARSSMISQCGPPRQQSHYGNQLQASYNRHLTVLLGETRSGQIRLTAGHHRSFTCSMLRFAGLPANWLKTVLPNLMSRTRRNHIPLIPGVEPPP